MNNTLVQLFKTLDAFVKVNVHANWESLHKDYTFVLESTGPSAVALALDCARADARLPLVVSVPVEDNGGVVGAAGGRVAEVVEVEVVMPKVPVAPRPKPGGSKSVPGEWNKLAREKKEAERKLVVEREEAEWKGLAEEEEAEEMMDWPLEGKGKGVVRETVGSPEVATRGSAQRRIKSAAFVVDSDEDDEEVPAAEPVPRATPAASPSKGRKVEVVLPALWVTIGQVKGTTVSPFTERFLPGSVTVPTISTMDDEAEEEWSGNNKMDIDELEGTPAVGKRKAVEVADEPVPKRTKAQGEKFLAVEEVIDDLPVEMRGAGEITKWYRAWLVANAQPSDIVSFFSLGLVFIADGLCF
jgi:hypothetical protein